MHSDIKEIIELRNKLEEIERTMEEVIKEHLSNEDWLGYLHAPRTPHPAVSVWLRERSSEVSRVFTVHDDLVTPIRRGKYDKGVYEGVKQALDNWLKEKADDS